MPLASDDFDQLATEHYTIEDGYEEPHTAIFAMLVDLAEVYVREVARRSSLSSSPPMEAALGCSLDGLRENLEMRLDIPF